MTKSKDQLAGWDLLAFVGALGFLLLTIALVVSGLIPDHSWGKAIVFSSTLVGSVLILCAICGAGFKLFTAWRKKDRS